MLNMPEEAGGRGLSMLAQVALEEESGKATNGLGFVVVDRGPAELWDIVTPEQREQFVGPILRGEYREAWAVTEPGAGSDVSAVAATAERDGDDWVLNGEKWFVTSEGDPGFYIVLAVVDGEQTLFIVEPWRPGPRDHEDARASCTTPTSTTTRRSSSRTAASPRRTASPRAAATGRASGSSSSASSSPRAAAAPPSARSSWRASSRWSARPSARPIADHQGVSFQLADSLTELLAARLLTYHAAQAFDSEPDRRVVHGKVAMAKLYASEMAGRVVDRSLQVLGGRGYMTENPVARFYREVRVDRIWEGTSEIQRLIVSRGLAKRGVETYLR